MLKRKVSNSIMAAGAAGFILTFFLNVPVFFTLMFLFIFFGGIIWYIYESFFKVIDRN